MINSTSNKQVKNLILLQQKAKARKEQGLFVTEGIKMYREVPKNRLVKTYVSESFCQKGENQEILKGIPETEREILADPVFKAASDTKTPQGILCLVKQQEYDLDQILKESTPLLLILEDIQDPGNLGTIFRTAEGAGVTGIIMSSQTADIYNPKTIRSTMGSLYRMPFLRVKELKPVLDELKKREIFTYAAHLKESVDYTKKDYTRGTAFMIGNEGNGLTEELSAQADAYIKIPMGGKLESLNAAIATAILTYEARRQRS